MFKPVLNNKGVVLYIVLATLLMVVILANILLTMMVSESRLTRHQISRIQAYYAALAGMNLAFEQIRTEEWPISGVTTYALSPTGTESDWEKIDPDIPYPVTITITDTDSGLAPTELTVNWTVRPTVDYTYVEP